MSQEMDPSKDLHRPYQSARQPKMWMALHNKSWMEEHGSQLTASVEKPGKFLCVRIMNGQWFMHEDEQVPACAWMNKLQRGRKLGVRECSAQAWRGECARGSETR